MASYEVRIKPSAVKELQGLQETDRARIVGKIQALGEEWQPRGSERLTRNDRYRVRQGIFRIVYRVDDEARTVTVVGIGHRIDVCR